MKKIYTLASLLIFTLIFSSPNYGQIRFTKIDPVANSLTIHNFGSSTVNISSYQICHKFSYQLLSSLTIDAGSLMLGAGNDLSLSGFTIDNTASDLGLYIDSNFSSPTSMLDFFQWGSKDNGRESVAVSKGIWTVGDFISTSGPYFYNGNGSQNGVSFWSNTVLNIEDITFSNNTFVFPNPVKNIINIKNSTTQKVITIELFDILGKQVFYKNTNNKNINAVDISNLSSGIYYTRLTNDSGALSYKKIIKD